MTSSERPPVPPAPSYRAERLLGIRRTLLVVLGLNLAVAIAKLAYGLWTGSIAMSADGVQSMLDGLSNVVGLLSRLRGAAARRGTPFRA
jgi:divalent metal cation (Fe/Co/Zn/Cd) transporter